MMAWQTSLLLKEQTCCPVGAVDYNRGGQPLAQVSQVAWAAALGRLGKGREQKKGSRAADEAGRPGLGAESRAAHRAWDGDCLTKRLPPLGFSL